MSINATYQLQQKTKTNLLQTFLVCINLVSNSSHLIVTTRGGELPVNKDFLQMIICQRKKVCIECKLSSKHAVGENYWLNRQSETQKQLKLKKNSFIFSSHLCQSWPWHQVFLAPIAQCRLQHIGRIMLDEKKMQ